MVLSVVMAEENQTEVLEVAVSTSHGGGGGGGYSGGGGVFTGLILVVPTGAMVEVAAAHSTPEQIKIILPV